MKRTDTMVKMLLEVGFVFLFSSSRPVELAAQEPCIEPPPGLVNWWPGDGNAEDIVGSRDGAPQNGATYAPGIVAQSFSFDGTDDFVAMTDFRFPTNLTIAAWIRPGRVVNEMIIATAVSITPPWPQSGLFVSAGPPGPQLRYFVDSDGSNRGYWYALYPFVVDTWHHVAVTQAGPNNLPALYVDGDPYPVVVDMLWGTPYRTTAPLSLGRQGATDGAYFQGALDEIEIYNRALTAEEVAAIYAAGSVGNCPVSVEQRSWGNVKRLYD